jgi:S1-C subfamily serine protease
MAADESGRTSPQRAAALVHLSGPKRGLTEALGGNRTIMVGVPGGGVELRSPSDDPRDPIAVLDGRGQTYKLTSGEGSEVWINGELVNELVLASGDVIELCGGTVLRFRLYPPGQGRYKTMAEAFSDCVDCARFGASTPLERAGVFASRVGPELMTQTAPRVRFALAALVIAAVGLSAAALVRSGRVESRLATETARIEGLAAMLEHSDSRVLDAADLEAIRSEIEELKDTGERLEELELRAGAGARVVASAARSVVFLQGAYGFVEPASGEPLRLATGGDGRLLVGPTGDPVVGLGGEGPVLEIFYTGTGFVATDDGRIVTNRHVAEPWLFDEQALDLGRRGLEPVMRRFIGYLPGLAEPFEVTLVASSDTADVAVLRCGSETASLPALALDRRELAPGEEVTVLGYPTGIRAMIARSQRAVLPVLEARGEVDFWEVAQVLAAGGHIAPLATRGIIGQITLDSVVYDAGTTHGGSGGPVIDGDGRVVAVNSAVMPDFAGANLGVPAAEALRLVEAAAR